MARRTSGRRTDYTWFEVGDVGLANALGGAGVLGGSGIVFAAAQTVTRIRGKVSVTLDTAGVDEEVMVACGITVMALDAFTAGVPPDFAYDGNVSEGNWIWTGLLYVTSGAEAAVVPDGLSASIDVDTKAMRRVKANEVLAFVHSAPGALVTSQGGTYDITYAFRMLTGL